MLERVLLTPRGLDLGSLAEAITYYGNVEVVYQNGQISDLIKQIGIDNTIRLAESDLVTFIYDLKTNAIGPDNSRAFPLSISCIHIDRGTSGKRIRNHEDELEETFIHSFGKGTISRKDNKRLASAIYSRPYQPLAAQGALEDINDDEFITSAIRYVIRDRIPNYPNYGAVSAKSHVHNGEFYIETNVDFDLATKLFRSLTGSHSSTITPEYLLVPILSMRTEMIYAGDKKCDIWADTTQSDLLRRKVNSFTERLSRSREGIDRFHDIIFSGRSFREAIDAGERSIIDVLEFGEREDTRKFKRWIKDGPSNGDLLAEYEKSKVSQSKLTSSLPFKVGKMVVFSGAGSGLEKLLGGDGLMGAIGGLASDAVLSFADKLLLSHLKLGWRPNQWVTKSAAPFLRGQ